MRSANARPRKVRPLPARAARCRHRTGARELQRGSPPLKMFLCVRAETGALLAKGPRWATMARAERRGGRASPALKQRAGQHVSAT